MYIMNHGLIIFFSIFGLIILSELGFRLWLKLTKGAFKAHDKIRYNQSHHIPHPYLPSTYRPDFTAPADQVDFPLNSTDLYYKESHINAYGYGFDEGLLKRDHKIVFLGNCVFGTGYYKVNDDTYSPKGSISGPEPNPR